MYQLLFLLESTRVYVCSIMGTSLEWYAIKSATYNSLTRHQVVQQHMRGTTQRTHHVK